MFNKPENILPASPGKIYLLKNTLMHLHHRSNKTLIMIRRLIFLMLIITSLSCKRNNPDVNISKIVLEFKIHRFEKELFETEPGNIEEDISRLSSKYKDFLDAFSFHVISIGLPSEKEYPGYLAMFLNDELNREVYNETIKLFPSLDKLESTFTNAFKRYTFHFPGKEIPIVVSYISRFNHSHFTVGNYIGIGLDKYLGPDHDYYKNLHLPLYQRQNMFREKIPSDVLFAFAAVEIPYDETTDNLLTRIIYQGKLMYFVDALLPDQPDSLKIGFTVNQMKWCRDNERGIWEYLIEHKLLFSTDQMIIRKLTEPAPFTYYFTGESPGRAAVWTGWQIVRAYARRNPELSLKEVLFEPDYQKILRGSRYNP